MSEIPSSDIMSLIWFAAVWVGYTWYADRGPWRKHSLRAVMYRHREEWMRPGKTIWHTRCDITGGVSQEQ
jgi:uncharacterized membrane protein